MTMELARRNGAAIESGAAWESKLDLIRRTYAPDATDHEFEHYLFKARRYGLEPGTQIHFTKRAGKLAIITAIDGYRLLADRSGLYAGNDDPTFGPEKEITWEVTTRDRGKQSGRLMVPSTATVTVWKLLHGQRCPFTATARWDEYYPGDHQGYTWRKMPHVMLGKCAEALALRKAFPAELSGLYTDTEMNQAGVAITETPAPAHVDQETGEVLRPGQISGPVIHDQQDDVTERADLIEEIEAAISELERLGVATKPLKLEGASTKQLTKWSEMLIARIAEAEQAKQTPPAVADGSEPYPF